MPRHTVCLEEDATADIGCFPAKRLERVADTKPLSVVLDLRVLPLLRSARTVDAM